jgi:TolB protein
MPLSRHIALVPGLALACLAAACDSETSEHITLPTRPILYQSQAPGGTEDLLTLDPATGSSRVLVSGDSVSARGLASWSRDGRRVAFVRESSAGDELHVLDPASGQHRRVGASLPPAAIFPEWSPDGATLALSAGATSRHVGVFLVEVASGHARVIRTGDASHRCPSWAPTGDRLVVAAYVNARSALVVLDTVGATVDTLLMSDSTYLDCPQWSPRGDAVLFTVFHGGGASGWDRPAFHSNLAVLSLRDRSVRQITEGAGLTNYGKWSPDGEWIVFQSDRASAPTTDAAGAGRMLQNLEIWVVRRDGSGLRRLTHNTHFDAHPNW